MYSCCFEFPPSTYIKYSEVSIGFLVLNFTILTIVQDVPVIYFGHIMHGLVVQAKHVHTNKVIMSYTRLLLLPTMADNAVIAVYIHCILAVFVLLSYLQTQTNRHEYTIHYISI